MVILREIGPFSFNFPCDIGSIRIPWLGQLWLIFNKLCEIWFAYSQLQSNRHSTLWKLWKVVWKAANGHWRNMWIRCGMTDFKGLPGLYIYTPDWLPPFSSFKDAEKQKISLPPPFLKKKFRTLWGERQFWNSFSREKKRSSCFPMRSHSAAI